MEKRHWRLRYVGVGLATTAIVLTSSLAVSAQGADAALGVVLPRSLVWELPLWLGIVGLLLGVLVAFIWLHLYQRQRAWQRAEFARQEVMRFQEKPGVKHVIDILDYEEYRLFYVTLPETEELVSFEATDERLKRALRSHDQMTKTRRGIDEIRRRAGANNLPTRTRAMFERYAQEEFFIEITLRDWFDAFLGGLENFNTLIEAGLITSDELKPFIIYWIQLIGDRRFRRQGGSSFYDQLNHYIYWAGYGGVQTLFERFGYKVLPPPYSSKDFRRFDEETDESDSRQLEIYRALCVAKAAHLVYEDRSYVNDIVRLWLSRERDNPWQRMSDREYVVQVIKDWLQEGQHESEFELRDNFTYLDLLTTDTQAFLFRQGKHILLIFRGSQQLNDWKTNFKIRLKAFTILADQETVPPQGRVHRGFLEAWQSAEKLVVYYLRKWWTPDTRLWIGGHSLGGALANMAAVSLESQGYRISGLYTFGQPRIADWAMVRTINAQMKERMVRFANNNDVVPLIPPPVVPWVPTRLYGHMGQFRYFSWRGNLRWTSFPTQRWPDRLLGFLAAIRQSGLDAVDDHKMEFYVANLQKALDKEQEMAKLEAERQMLAADYTEPEKPRPVPHKQVR